jgi:uncharacterized protein (UPF0276 family)
MQQIPISMLFAINYSLQAAKLCAEGRLEVDRFKCPDWPDMIDEAQELRAVAVHFTLKVGRSKTKKTNWEKIARLLDQTGTLYVNVHLEGRPEDFASVSDSIPIDTVDPAHRQQVLEQTLEDLWPVVKRFGAGRVIVENGPYRPTGNLLRPAVETEFISQVVEETGCGLLLDISHAIISAHHLGLSAQEYMARLPVHRLSELHFAGVHNLDGWLQDHLPALPADWEVLDWVLQRVRSGAWPHPWLLAFEYGGIGEKFAPRSEASVIEAQGGRLYQMVKEMADSKGQFVVGNLQ